MKDRLKEHALCKKERKNSRKNYFCSWWIYANKHRNERSSECKKKKPVCNVY